MRWDLLDHTYLENWIRGLGLATEWNDARSVSPNEGKNPRPRLLKIAFCSSRNKILTDISPSLDARLEGQRIGFLFCVLPAVETAQSVIRLCSTSPPEWLRCYQAQIRAELHRAIRELRNLQAERKGKQVSTPCEAQRRHKRNVG
jgi:hypothetical protein